MATSTQTAGASAPSITPIVRAVRHAANHRSGADDWRGLVADIAARGPEAGTAALAQLAADALTCAGLNIRDEGRARQFAAAMAQTLAGLQPEPTSGAQALLYEHADGRCLVALPGSPSVARDPGWVRQYPVEVDAAVAQRHPSAEPATVRAAIDSARASAPTHLVQPAVTTPAQHAAWELEQLIELLQELVAGPNFETAEVERLSYRVRALSHRMQHLSGILLTAVCEPEAQ